MKGKKWYEQTLAKWPCKDHITHYGSKSHAMRAKGSEVESAVVLLKGRCASDGAKLVWSVYHLADCDDPRSRTICISSSVGCVGGCLFCLSRNRRFERPYTVEELLCQIYYGMKIDFVEKVIAGDKPPTIYINTASEGDSLRSNLENIVDVYEFAEVSGLKTKITTIGDEEKFKELLEKHLGRIHPVIKLSLNFRPEQRCFYMPATRGQNMENTRELLGKIARAKTSDQAHNVIISWLLIKGVNDTKEDVQYLKWFAEGIDCRVNIQPLSEVTKVRQFPLTQDEDVDIFAGKLEEAGVSTVKKVKIIKTRYGLSCGTTVIDEYLDAETALENAGDNST